MSGISIITLLICDCKRWEPLLKFTLISANLIVEKESINSWPHTNRLHNFRAHILYLLFSHIFCGKSWGFYIYIYRGHITFRNNEGRCKQESLAIGRVREHKLISAYYLEMRHKSLGGYLRRVPQRAPPADVQCGTQRRERRPMILWPPKIPASAGEFLRGEQMVHCEIARLIATGKLYLIGVTIRVQSSTLYLWIDGNDLF